MTAKIIDGVDVASRIRGECKLRVEQLRHRGCAPGLAVLGVGSNPASVLCIRNRIRACGDVGIRSFLYEFSKDVSTSKVIRTIEELTDRGDVHGILVQLPLTASSADGRGAASNTS